MNLGVLVFIQVVLFSQDSLEALLPLPVGSILSSYLTLGTHFM